MEITINIPLNLRIDLNELKISINFTQEGITIDTSKDNDDDGISPELKNQTY